MKTNNTFAENQRNQLNQISSAAAELVGQRQGYPLSEVMDHFLQELQKKFPIALPMLLLEAVYQAVESNSYFSAEDKQTAKESRKECKKWREGIYDNLNMKFYL